MALLGALIERYGLKKSRPRESVLMVDWWEGRHKGRLIAFVEMGMKLAMYLGEAPGETEIYLVRAAPDDAPDLEATKKDIARICGGQGAALAASFRLAATPSEKLFDIPQLRLPALRDGVPRLSPSVLAVMINESMRGLSLLMAKGATQESVAADLEIAHALLSALEKK
jgi:hypothetical protein